MKKLFIMAPAALLFLCASLTAQKTFKKAFSASASPKVHIEISRASLQITGYNGSELLIETKSEHAGPPERAKGLRPLSTAANDNTGIGLEVQEAGGVMTIKKAGRQDAEYKIKVPANASVKIEEDGWEGGDFSVNGVSGEVEINANNAEIKLENVTGPVVANATNGNIDVVFSRLNQDKPTHVNATNGHIDVTLPSDSKAKLSMSTINGETYTDFDIKLPDSDKGKKKAYYGSKTEGTVNGGGVEVTLHAINDNIYLRKKQ